MNDTINIALALFAGIVSFLSPCVLPLIPSYLSFIGGVSYNDLQEKRGLRWPLFLKTLLFVIGFSVVFIILGVVFSGAGIIFGGAMRIINIIAGSIVIALGLHYIFNFWKILNFEKRFHLKKHPQGAAGPVLLGMAFGAGWTPCIGPILASILFLAGTSTQGFRGTVLLTAYSAGLGIPFIITGLFFSGFQRKMEKFTSHLQTVKIVSGVFLVFIGLLIFIGSLTKLNVFFFQLAGNLEMWSSNNVAGSRLLFGFPFLFISLLLVFFYLRRVHRSIAVSGMAFSSFLFPLRLLIIIAFAGIALLSFTGLIKMYKVITFWLRFQGI